jgi:hypothetical protein
VEWGRLESSKEQNNNEQLSMGNYQLSFLKEIIIKLIEHW